MAAESEAERLLRQGIQAVRDGRSQDALKLLSRAITLEPENEKAWLWISAVLPEEERIECLKRVVAINPQNELALKGLEFLLADKASADKRAPAVSAPEPSLEIPLAEAERAPRADRRKWPLYVGVALLAIVALSICAVALVMGAIMLTAPSSPVGPASVIAQLPAETSTPGPQSTLPPASTATATRIPVPTNTLVVPGARIPGFPIIHEGAYDEIEARVGELRGLQPVRETPRQTLTRYRLEEYLIDVYRREEYVEQTEITGRIYRVLGLIDEEYDLVEGEIEMQREYLAGLYDSGTEDIYLVLDRYTSDLWLEVTFAHEFTHALQDQHFDLDALQGGAETTDSLLALQGLIEGDATLVMMEYAFQYLFEVQFDRADLLAAIQEVELGEYEDAPGVIRETASFAYDQGLVFVAALEEQGSWDLLNQAFRDPPQTTEQIMHPDKYLAGEVGQIPEMGDLVGALGVEWSELRRDVFGELFIRIYLERELGSEEALMAAEGWEGDRVVFLANEDHGTYLLLLRMRWESADDAEEFLSAYATFMQRARVGPNLTDDPARGLWHTEGQATYLSRDGEEVLLVLGSDQEALDLVLTEFPGF